MNGRMDRQLFMMEMTRLFSGFGRRESVEMGESYYDALQFCDIKHFSGAVTKALQEDNHFPKTPRLIEIINLLENQGRDWKNTESSIFSFECEDCRDTFAMIKEKMDTRKAVRCDCGRVINVSTLKQAMEQAINEHTSYARI